MKRTQIPRIAVGLFFLLGAYFILRLTNITALPIFTDEAIYIRWSQIGAQDPNWRFISLTDGKQPLFTWILMVLLRLIPSDPLFVGRLVSVFAGSMTLVGLWMVSYALFSHTGVAFVASALYVVCPFGLLYDRLALYDSLVAALFVWNMTLAIYLAKKPRLDIALIFGMTLAAGMLNKSSGFISLYLVPSTLLLFDWRPKTRVARFIRWCLYIGIAGFLSQLLYSVLRLSPLFHMVGLKDSVFVYPLSEWVHHPFQFFVGNLRGLFDWLVGYLTIPLGCSIVCSICIFWKYWREKLFLFIYWLLPFTALALFGKVLYPRFLLFMVPPLLVLSALTIVSLLTWSKRKLITGFILLLFLSPLFRMSYGIVFDPIRAPIPKPDRGQLIDDWPAGGGIREVVDYIRKQSATGPVAVYTEGTFGLLPYALEIYLVDRANITIRGIWPLPATVPKEITAASSVSRTYLILNQTQEQPVTWPLTLIARYQKGLRPDRSLQLYEITPETNKQ